MQFDDDYFSVLWDCMVDFMAGDVSYEVWRIKQAKLAAASREVARNAIPLGTFASCMLEQT